MATAIDWPDEIDEVITGDITAAAAYLTPAGGAVVTGVAPCGIDSRDEGLVGFTTSLGFGKKLTRIISNPRVALAYHTRQHGFSDSPRFVLAQGRASVDISPSQARLEAFAPQAARYLGPAKRGKVWDLLLREYYFERVFVDLAVERIVAWPDLGAAGPPDVFGVGGTGPPTPQSPPKGGTRPRVDLAKTVGQLAGLPHRLLAYQGSDGLPVVVPVEVGGHDERGIRLVTPDGLLPPGGRRAGFLAHSYRPQLVGLSTRSFTGWLDVADDGAAVYSPHTSKGFWAPPAKSLLLVTNGLFAKLGMWQASRDQVAGTLTRLQAEALASDHVRPASTSTS